MSSTPNAIPRTAPKSQSTPYGIRVVASAANYNPACQLSGCAQGVSHQTYQSNLPYCGYQKTDKKTVYQLDKNQIKNQPKGFYTIFNEDDEDVIYADVDFKEVVVNFVGIEALCSKCRATFPSKTKLYHHLKSGYQEVTSPSLPAEQAFSIPYHCLQGCTPVIWLWTCIQGLDIRHRNCHLNLRSSAARIQTRINCLPWYRVWGNPGRQELACEKPTGKENQHYIHSSES